MIPEQLRALVEQQPGNVKRARRDEARRAIEELGVSKTSEFAEFYQNYKITMYRSVVSDEQLCDVLEPSKEVALGTAFVRDVWKVPEKYICLTSAEGEGAYLYDRETGTVSDFFLAHADAFCAGRVAPRWSSFYEFMSWYLSPNASSEGKHWGGSIGRE